MVPSEPLDTGRTQTDSFKSTSADELELRAPRLPPEIHAIIIDCVSNCESELGWSPNSRIYGPLVRNTFHALCLVNKTFESLAVRHLYSRVHITTQTQLAAFRKAIAYFGRPTALARYVQTLSISCTTHIASYQFSNDLVVVLHTLHSNLERLLLDIRRRHLFRPSHSPNAQDTGPVILCGGASKMIAPSLIFSLSWPKLIEVSISEGLDQYVHLSCLPRAFDNVKRLALGYTMLTGHTVRKLSGLPWLEELVLVNSTIRWSDFKQTVPPEPMVTLMSDSPNLRRFVWIITPRPQWDMEHSWDEHATVEDAEQLSNVPGVEVFYWPEIQSDEETRQEGLAGPRFLGESAKYGTLWERND